MAWPNPFYRRTPNTRTCWQYTFELTDEHLTPEQCAPLKQSYDVIGERVYNRLNEISPPTNNRNKETQRDTDHNPQNITNNDNNSSAFTNVVPPNLHSESDKGPRPKVPQRDLYQILKDNYRGDALLEKFWRDVNTVPDWVDWAQIERGQDVFYRYGGACLTGLAFQSLLGGMGAARVVETLARTGGFSTKVARGRLFETTQHILQCTKSLESMKPGGDGFASTLRVRLLHAAVRNRILSMEKARPGYYDTASWGVPINDLDSLATIASFSSTLIWLSLPRQGLFLRRQEIEDYVALWRYIAYVIGCPDEGFRTPGEAKRLVEILLFHEVQPSSTSKIMANNIIKSLEGQPPAYTSSDMLIVSARWLNGNDLCDALGLARPSVYYWALMVGQCLFFCFFIYLYRSFETLDRKKIALLKKAFWAIIVKSKYGLQGKETTFDMKYIPEYSTITEMGECVEEQTGAPSDVEQRNLRSFLIGAACLVVLALVLGKSLLKIVELVR